MDETLLSDPPRPDRLPDVFTAEMWQAEVETGYQHVYDSYYGEGRSVYSQAAAQGSRCQNKASPTAREWAKLAVGVVAGGY